MAAPYLPLPETVDISPGSEAEESARVLVAQFGSAYAQRAGDGLNAVTAELAVTFDNLTRDECNTLIEFLREQGGYKAFIYTPPGEIVERMWTCDKWKRRYVDATIDSLSCTFKEVFTP